MTKHPDHKRRWLAVSFLVVIFGASYFPAAYLQTSLSLAPAWRSLLMIAVTVFALAVGSFFIPLSVQERAELELAERAAVESMQPRCRRCETTLGDISFRCSKCGATQAGGTIVLCALVALVATLALLFSGALG